MSATRTLEETFGDHRVWLEEPDTMVMEVHGPVTEAHAQAIMAKQAATVAGRRYMFLLIDMNGFTSISPGARRTFAGGARDMPPMVSVYFGLSFRGRVMVEMLLPVVNLFNKRHRHRFCEDGEAARAYIAEIRPSYA